jgi:hypothetical protein
MFAVGLRREPVKLGDEGLRGVDAYVREEAAGRSLER